MNTTWQCALHEPPLIHSQARKKNGNPNHMNNLTKAGNGPGYKGEMWRERKK